MDSILKDDDLDDCTNSPTILFLIPRLHLEPVKNINIDILFIRNWTKKRYLIGIQLLKVTRGQSLIQVQQGQRTIAYPPMDPTGPVGS